MKRKYYFVPKEANYKKNSASFLELFFDLVFVAFVGAFVHRITYMVEHNDLHWFSVSFVFLTLLSVIIVWRQYTIYSSRYEDIYNYRHRIFTLLIMIGIGIISAALYLDLGDHLENLSKVVIVTVPGYILTIVPLAYLHISAAIFANNKYENKKQWISGIGILISGAWATIGSLLAILYNETLMHSFVIFFWLLCCITWVATTFWASSMKISINTRDTSLGHLQERFGIIFIVFIGESIIQSISGASKQFLENTADSVGKLVLMIVVLFSWWWWFNDTINYPNIINHPRKISLYKFSLMFILIGLSISAVGFSGTISNPNDSEWKFFLVVGIMVWSIANSVLFVSLKDYNLKDKVIFPRFLRISIYTLPLWNAPLFGIAFIDSITTEEIFFISTAFSFMIFPLSISIIIYRKKKMEDTDINFEKMIKKYYIDEDKWIEKSAYKYIDKDLHKEFDNNLNHYSKYIK